uniref:Protein kinase domain-containing protein n=1 Tax=Maylandia zebra TaxID=106582 RepID=A0A3P9DU08_9CICH
MREKLQQMSELAQSHMAAAQRQQKTLFDKKARHRSFVPGQKVLVIKTSSVLFLTNPQRKQTHYTMSANPSFGSDELGISKGTILGDHHMVEAFLGEGGFGVVTKCRDTKNNQTVAVKVNKSNPEILLQAKLEIFILEQLRRLDPDRCNIVEWNGYFLDGERICLNFELLDQSLSDYIGDRNNQGLPMRELRPILHQLANALFHLGSVGIVHADLKPVNIMVVNRSESQVRVKLIDFGIACNTSAVIPGDCVGTIGYCAPEIMLGTPYDEAIDMWSLGLVAVELATGVPLYPGEDDYDVLKFIIETQGQLPDHLLESGLYTDNYRSKETRSIKLKCLDDLEQLLKVRRGPENGQSLFVRLIKEMLALDANQRITPSEVLKHPFFDPGLSRRTPCTDMNSTGGELLVLSQQPSRWKSHGSQKFRVTCPSLPSLPISSCLPLPAPPQPPIHAGPWSRGMSPGCRGGYPPLSPSGCLCLNFIPQLRHSHYSHPHYTYI